MGARITGVGSGKLVIDGVKELHGARYRVMPDRIECGTYACAAAITGGELRLVGGQIEHLGAVVRALEEAGVEMVQEDGAIRVQRTGALRGVDIMTEPYPGFPTDMQAQFMALLSVAEGASMVTETIFENRFMHVPNSTAWVRASTCMARPPSSGASTPCPARRSWRRTCGPRSRLSSRALPPMGKRS